MSSAQRRQPQTESDSDQLDRIASATDRLRVFTYRVEWSHKDAAWRGTCDEFPSRSRLAADPTRALWRILDEVAAAVEDDADGSLSQEYLSGIVAAYRREYGPARSPQPDEQQP